MAKYDPLRDLLMRQSGRVTLPLAEIESVVQLPSSAKQHEWWWANEDVQTTAHVQCKAWQEAGYNAEPNLRGGTVTFVPKNARA